MSICITADPEQHVQPDRHPGVLRRAYPFDQLWTGCSFNPYEHCRTDLIVEWCCGPNLHERGDLWLGPGLGLDLAPGPTRTTPAPGTPSTPSPPKKRSCHPFRS